MPLVSNVISTSYNTAKLDADRRVLSLPDVANGSVPIALARQGLIPTSPIAPESAIEVKTLELYRTVNSRCPSLGVQPFVRSMCDLQQVCKLNSDFNQLSHSFISFRSSFALSMQRHSLEPLMLT